MRVLMLNPVREHLEAFARNDGDVVSSSEGRLNTQTTARRVKQPFLAVWSMLPNRRATRYPLWRGGSIPSESERSSRRHIFIRGRRTVVTPLGGTAKGVREYIRHGR